MSDCGSCPRRHHGRERYHVGLVVAAVVHDRERRVGFGDDVVWAGQDQRSVGVDHHTHERVHVAAPVARSPIELTNPARLTVPVTVICTSLPSATLTAMIETGHIPSELLSVRDVRYIDLPTGHWPMFSRPKDLTNLFLAEVTQTGPSESRRPCRLPPSAVRDIARVWHD